MDGHAAIFRILQANVDSKRHGHAHFAQQSPQFAARNASQETVRIHIEKNHHRVGQVLLR